MALSIEFLYAKDDIPDFVEFLYNNGGYIWHRNPQKCSDTLSQERAINALTGDLFTPFGTYYIGIGDNRKLLYFDSCGRQGHPRNLGKRGRFAGRIVCDTKESFEAMSYFKLIKSYFRRVYRYQRYNGSARMSCYFGPHYLMLDEKYILNPEPEGLCPGFLRILCGPTYKALISDLIVDICSEKNAIECTSLEWCNYWEDADLLELKAELLYHSSVIDYDRFTELVCQIYENPQIIRISNCKLYMSASVHFPLSWLKKSDKMNMSFVMEHPW